MSFYTDIHSHMLASVDDGASSDDEMFEMLDMAYRSGTRAICLTPHYNHAYFGDTVQRSERSFEVLREYAESKYPDMQLYLGNEMFFCADCMSHIGEGGCRTLNSTKYVLIDFPFGMQFYLIEHVLGDLLAGGYIPVFAHVERYDCIRPPFDELIALKERGVKIQVNSTSICGGWGRALKNKAKKLLKMRIPDIVASDAHNTSDRNPDLSGCEKIITKYCGAEYANEVLNLNPSKIIKSIRK